LIQGQLELAHNQVKETLLGAFEDLVSIRIEEGRDERDDEQERVLF
jgi:hypothetical protein